MSARILICLCISCLLIAALARVSCAANTVAVNGENAGNNAIQAAINAAAPNTTILIGPGNYPEQLFVSNKSVSLVGAGPSNTVIDPSSIAGVTPAVFIAHYSNSTLFSIITVSNSINTTVSGVHVEALPAANYLDSHYTGCLNNAHFSAISYLNASGAILGTNVTNATLGHASGCQSQIGAIEVLSVSPGTSNVVIGNNRVSDYMKQGIGCKYAGTTCWIRNNTVNGDGRISSQDQLSVTLYAGATGSIINNTITNTSYDNPANNGNYFTSSQGIGIYATAPGINVSDNRLYDNDVGIDLGNDYGLPIGSVPATIDNNTFVGQYNYSVIVDGFDGNFFGDYSANSPIGILVTDGQSADTAVNVMDDVFSGTSSPYQVEQQGTGIGSINFCPISSACIAFAPPQVSLSAPSNSTLHTGQYEYYSANGAYGIGPFVLRLMQEGRAAPVAIYGPVSSNSFENENGIAYGFPAFWLSYPGNYEYYATLTDNTLNITVGSPANAVAVSQVTDVYVNGNVVDDEAMGGAGYWALQNFTRVVKAWQYGPQSYIASVRDFGSAYIPEGAVSPGHYGGRNGTFALQTASGIAAFSGTESFVFNSTLSGNALPAGNSSIGTYDAGGTANDLLGDSYASQTGDAGETPQEYYLGYLMDFFTGNLLGTAPANYSWTYSANTLSGIQGFTYSSSGAYNNIALYSYSNVMQEGITIPPNAVLVVQAPSEGALLSVSTNSPAGAAANVILYNVTSEFSGTEPSGGRFQTLTAIRIVNVTVNSPEQGGVSINITMGYSGNLNGNMIAPFLYNATTATWRELSSYVTNESANAVTFALPADPTVGIFSVAVTAPPRGSGGKPAPSMPTITKVMNNYTITDLERSSTFAVSAGGQTISGTVSSLAPNVVVLINSVPYTLYLDTPVKISGNYTSQQYVELTGVSTLTGVPSIISLFIATVPPSPMNATTTATTSVRTTTVAFTTVYTTVPPTTTQGFNVSGLPAAVAAAPPGEKLLLAAGVLGIIMLIAEWYVRRKEDAAAAADERALERKEAAGARRRRTRKR
jgi:hypothetical protein